jgi:carbamoyltransferase
VNILGISCYYHDSAACLVVDGCIVAAVQEERFTRKKNDSSFPKDSIRFCLKEGAISADCIDYVVFYEKPFNKFERILDTYLEFSPFGFKNFSKSFLVWAKDKLFQKRNLIENLADLLGKNINWSTRILFSDHHFSHAASAFYPSPFEEAAILTVDGVGEWATTSIAVGKNDKISTLKEIRFPHSLGLLYSAFTYYIGFKVNSGEYKVMGLAPYGNPLYVDVIKNNLIKINEDGSFYLNMDFFSYTHGLTMTNAKFHGLFGSSPRNPETALTQFHKDIAASIQAVAEDVLIKMAREVARITGKRNLCLAGGVAMNCVANGKVYFENIFENIWVQPAAGDSGGALGAALAVYHHMLGLPKKKLAPNQYDLMNGALLGPQYSNLGGYKYSRKTRSYF